MLKNLCQPGGRLNFQMIYFLYLIFFQAALVTTNPVDSSDPLFGSDALGGFADKVKGWTETAWSNSKVGKDNMYKDCNQSQFRVISTHKPGLDRDSLAKYKGRHKVHDRGWRRHGKVERVR